LEDDVRKLGADEISQFWYEVKELYPTLSTLMLTLLSIPHSNAQSERVFSMLKKIYTEQRADLCQESIVSLLAIKMNNPHCCVDTKNKPPLLRKLKRAAMTYNQKHPSKE
jgi:hypothetical protein